MQMMKPLQTLMLSLATFSFLSYIPAASAAQDANALKPFFSFGSGNDSCQSFVDAAAREKIARSHAHHDENDHDAVLTADYAIYIAWMEGWLSARNFGDPLHRGIGGSFSRADQLKWLYQICSHNNQAAFGDVVEQLRESMLDGLARLGQ
jgi:hypothetical protein